MLRISDLGYYLTIIRGILNNSSVYLYLPESHSIALSNLTGKAVAGVMPIGASPTSFLIFLPFALMPVSSYALTISLWNSIGITMFLSQWRLTPKSWWVLGLVCILSFANTANFLLGQVTLLAVSTLCLVFELSCQQASAANRALIIIGGIIVSFKLHYFAIYIVILLTFRRWNEIAGCLLILGVLTVLALIWFPAPVYGFLDSLLIFLNTDKQRSYGGAFSSEHMNIFVNAFREILERKNATLISLLIGGSLALFSLVYSLKFSYSILPICLLTGAYLLFAPHMGNQYEDLLLMLPIFILARSFPEKVSLFRTSLMAMLLIIVMNSLDYMPLYLFWIIKVILLTIIVLGVSQTRVRYV